MLSPLPSPKISRKRSIKEGILSVSETVTRSISPLCVRTASTVGTKILLVPQAAPELRKAKSSSHLKDARDQLSGGKAETRFKIHTKSGWEAFQFSDIPDSPFHPRKAPKPEEPALRSRAKSMGTGERPVVTGQIKRPMTMPANLKKPLPQIPADNAMPALRMSGALGPAHKVAPSSPLTVIPESPAEYPAPIPKIWELEGCSPVKCSSPTLPDWPRPQTPENISSKTIDQDRPSSPIDIENRPWSFITFSEPFSEELPPTPPETPDNNHQSWLCLNGSTPLFKFSPPPSSCASSVHNGVEDAFSLESSLSALSTTRPTLLSLPTPVLLQIFTKLGPSPTPIMALARTSKALHTVYNTHSTEIHIAATPALHELASLNPFYPYNQLGSQVSSLHTLLAAQVPEFLPECPPAEAEEALHNLSAFNTLFSPVPGNVSAQSSWLRIQGLTRKELLAMREVYEAVGALLCALSHPWIPIEDEETMEEWRMWVQTLPVGRVLPFASGRMEIVEAGLERWGRRDRRRFLKAAIVEVLSDL
ncbi:hypothetical protein EDC01DRAFT_653255 [Geopyxis carbonaria]|nr:hypothetical protein EDC01DRAFT_653255 [Geopyxis carbonaria]